MFHSPLIRSEPRTGGDVGVWCSERGNASLEVGVTGKGIKSFYDSKGWVQGWCVRNGPIKDEWEVQNRVYSKGASSTGTWGSDPPHRK